ncbi:MAG: hypothetical protein N2745_09980 [Syntrophorhabdaceae bacterium]|nr:hypothetical protein [Syntrophorhabdaceae bacterium]
MDTDDRDEKRDELADQFKRLTHEALGKDDTDSFIEVLLQRNAIIERIMEENVEVVLKEEERLLFIEMEDKILKRLEGLKEDVFEELTKISDKRRAIRTYSPKFPFPSMPAFFDKEG